jgi:hypothetical protein
MICECRQLGHRPAPSDDGLTGGMTDSHNYLSNFWQFTAAFVQSALLRC